MTQVSSKKWFFVGIGFVLGILWAGCGGSDGIVPPSIAQALGNAVDVIYDNATSGAAATDVQAALDEVDARVDVLEGASPTLTKYNETIPLAVNGTRYNINHNLNTLTPIVSLAHGAAFTGNKGNPFYNIVDANNIEAGQFSGGTPQPIEVYVVKP